MRADALALGRGWLWAARRIPGALLVVFVLAGTPAQASDVVRIAFASAQSASDDKADLELLRTRLREAGLLEKGLEIVYQQTTAEAKRQQADVRALLSKGPFRLLIARSMDIAQTAQTLDPQLPIVFGGQANPVRMCMALSLGKPGLNVTGYTTWIRSEAKMMEALDDAYPGIERWLVLYEDGGPDRWDCTPDSKGVPVLVPASPCVPGPIEDSPRLSRDGAVPPIRKFAASRSQSVLFFGICSVGDFEGLAAFAPMRQKIGVVVPLTYFFHLNRHALVNRLNSLGLRAVYARTPFSEAGGLMVVDSSGGSGILAETYDLVAQVLRGRPPGELPIQAPSGFRLHINLKTALLLNAPPSLRALTRADMLIDP
jgi:putative tryptophan/tyrosine transport system substrate-binding protein